MPAERPEQLDPGDRIALSRVPADHLVAGLPDQLALRGIVRMLGSLLQIRIDTIRVEKARLRSSPEARRSSMSMITPGRSTAVACSSSLWLPELLFRQARVRVMRRVIAGTLSARSQALFEYHMKNMDNAELT
jgi:hypothetical protein